MPNTSEESKSNAQAPDAEQQKVLDALREKDERETLQNVQSGDPKGQPPPDEGSEEPSEEVIRDLENDGIVWHSNPINCPHGGAAACRDCYEDFEVFEEGETGKSGVDSQAPQVTPMPAPIPQPVNVTIDPKVYEGSSLAPLVKDMMALKQLEMTLTSANMAYLQAQQAQFMQMMAALANQKPAPAASAKEPDLISSLLSNPEILSRLLGGKKGNPDDGWTS